MARNDSRQPSASVVGNTLARDFSAAVVGWALDTALSTRLPLAALAMAIRRRHPASGLLHHSDRGCQYTSAEYRSALAELGVTVSMSEKEIAGIMPSQKGSSRR
jgi:transposase InsO family protein